MVAAVVAEVVAASVVVVVVLVVVVVEEVTLVVAAVGCRLGARAAVQVGGPVQRLSLRLELERGAAWQRASGSEREERAVASVSSER